MKATDFKREHFTNGKSFSQADFADYIQASDKLAKTLYTRYLPCLLGGVLVSFVFSKGVGGFIGNMLAVLCIFAGLIVGGIFNVRAGKAVKECAAKLGISSADVAEARKRVKSGTVAWSGGADDASFEAQAQAPARAYSPKEAEAAPMESALPKNPLRAVWAAGAMAAAWLLLMIFQLAFGSKLLFSGAAFIFIVAGMLGAAAYLMAQPERKPQLFGGGIGVAAALLLAGSTAASYRAQVFYMGYTGRPLGVDLFFDFSDPVFMQSLGWAFLCALLCLGAAFAARFLRKEYGKGRVRLGSLLAGAAYFIIRLASEWMRIRMMLMQPFVSARDWSYLILPMLGAALAIYLSCMAVYALANIKSARVRLRGAGLVWAWLAAAGAAVTVIAALSAGTSVSSGPAIPGITAVYTMQLILGFSALTGYVLLLCKRRAGLYVILLGVGLMLGAQGINSLSVVNSGYGLALTLSTVLGGVNPLLAWLSVRSGDKRALRAAANAVK